MNEFPDIPEDVRQLLHAAGRPALTLLNCWCGMRVGRAVPGRQDFDPTRLGRYLAKVYLYGFDDAAGDFICRLAGEQVHEAWGVRIKGLSLREVVGDANHPAALERWRGVVETPLVQYGILEEKVGRKSKRIGERLIVPMRDDDHQIRLVLGLGDYEVRQNDRDWIQPVWSDVIRIPCADIENVGGTPPM
ncbi:MAG: PAS domain-containing protein [Minwuia sp.]|nr:PAS domain-containing protein [Minwuia sp.]